jgi:hypothetical protein
MVPVKRGRVGGFNISSYNNGLGYNNRDYAK